MVVISRILHFSLLGSLLLTSYSPLLGMQAVARLLGRASRMTKPSFKPNINLKLQAFFKSKPYTQPQPFISPSVPKYSNTQPLSWWQRFTAWAKSWRMPQFNTTKSYSALGVKRLMPSPRMVKNAVAIVALQGKREMPAFTIENIDAYPEYAEKFLGYLKEHPEYFNIDTKSAIKAAIIHFLNKYPYYTYDISSIIVHRLEYASCEILDVILQRIKSDLEKGNVFAEIEKNKLSKKACAIIFTNFDTNVFARMYSIKLLIEYIPEVGESVLSLIEQHAEKIPAKNIDDLHSFLAPEQQQRIEKAIKQKLGLSAESSDISVIEKILLYHDTFSFLTKCTKDNHGATATEKHYCANQNNILLKLCKASYIKEMTPELCPMFIRLFKKEQEETAKGNYVFYHAQRWSWHFKADMYKQFMNLTKPTKVGDDYQFLRFGNKKNNRYVRDIIFMNGALFGNAMNPGACSFSFMLQNHDFSAGKDAKLSARWIARQQFGMDFYYKKHKTAFEELEHLHNKASKHGNFLLISVPQDKVNDWVYIAGDNAQPWEVATKRGRLSRPQAVIDMLKENPDDIYDSDRIEYAMPMEGDVLDPQKGPRMYAFNNADPKIMEEYRTKRDQLFATIKAEIEQSLSTQ